jgi:outer membrane protein OmpA-like peptidoglycan-associated protein/tetratricopeptide (TPR) repeat protein
MKTLIILLKLNVALFAVLLFNGITFGQNSLEKAKQLAVNFQYQKAIEQYKAYFAATPPAIDDARALADCYIQVNDTKSAALWMGKVVAMNAAKPADVKTYAGLLKSEGNYEDAIVQYRKYESMLPAESDKAAGWIAACRDAEQWTEKPEYIDVSNAAMFNTENSEFGLIPFNKGFVLTTDRKVNGQVYNQEDIYGWTGKPYLKQYYAVLNTDGKSVYIMQPLSDLNYKYHNGPGTWDSQDQTMLYTRTKMVRVTKKPINSDPTSWSDHSSAADYTNRLEIYTAKFKNNVWTDIKAFAYNKAEEYSVGHPAMSNDGNVLYFVSDKPGGYGGSDIYYCEKTGEDTWSQPKNAGSTINTDGNEVFPFVGDNGVLYFSSDGLPGMGGLDMFSAKGSKETWSVPENLKAPMNSPKDDFSVFYEFDGKSGYFASNRDGGMGMDDIYNFRASPPTTLILAVVAKEKTEDNKLLPLRDVDIAMKNKTTEGINTMPTNAMGVLYTMIDCATAYEITGSKEGYFTQMKNVEKHDCASKHDTVFVELTFDRIIIDKPIVLKNIYYDFDKWNIRPDAAIELDKLVTILLQNPSIEIELGSHTDSRGSDQYNMVLSQHRAESAVNYIVSKGIADSRITAQGYGESVPVNQCTNGAKCTEEEFQMNRRTEFKVTKINKVQTSEAQTPR